MVKSIHEEFKKLSEQERAAHLQKYFKTGKGEYGEGDVFLGLRVPTIRNIAKKLNTISIDETEEFLQSPYHEISLFALFVIIDLFKKAKEKDRKKIYDLYLKNTNFINNWDLVDASSPTILGGYLFDKNRSLLYDLANSDNLWKQRIAIIATLYFIRRNDFYDTLAISEILLLHHHDLIHKAVGWMIREVGKRDKDLAITFLLKHYTEMPRTMLRYAIEKFDEDLRQQFLQGYK